MWNTLHIIPPVSSTLEPEGSVPIADGELTSGANGQLLTSTSPKAQRLLANPKNMPPRCPPRCPQGCPAWIPPSSRGSGIPWDPSQYPSVISYFEGPHFSYGRTSDDSKRRDSGRHFVLSRDTVVVLALNFNPGPNFPLAFDALDIPLTKSVRYAAEPKDRRLLSLRILLVDAVTEMFVRVDKWGHTRVDENTLAPSLVDFQADYNIIELHNGRAIMRFTLPCCFLDAMHRTGHYRLCITLRLEGKYIGIQTLPGDFEVVHMRKDIAKISLQYQKEIDTAGEAFLGQQQNYCWSTSNSHTNDHSYWPSIIDGCFANTLSLALGLVSNPIPIREIFASGNHRHFCYLERRRLKTAIELEYDYIERILTRVHFDTAILQRQYEAVISYIHSPSINWLPVELLIMVFSFIPDEHFETLVLTCHKWKEIILSMWSPLNLGSWTPLGKVKAILHRSTGILSVTIDPSRDAMDSPTNLLEREKYGALMLATSTSISRWRTLDILSLPDPQQATHFVGGHIPTVPMDHLRSLRIPIHHELSHFLDLLLPSIGATTSVLLTDMHLCSTQAILYLTQPHCVHIFNHLTSFKCFLSRVGDVIDILPHFWRIETLDLSGFHFPTYTLDVELPLTKTLRRVSLKGTPIGWMNHREFLQLESCVIVSPPAVDTIPVTTLPLCKDLFFEGPRFDSIRGFRVSSIHNLTLRSPQWSKSRGNGQLSRIWTPGLRHGALRPLSLSLHLTCSSEQLLRALRFMPELKNLVLELDRATALGSSFFKAFLSQSSRITWRADQGNVPLQACPQLEVLGLKYRRWFRPGEPNEMPALVAMARLDNRDQKIKIWVEKGLGDPQKIHINYPDIPISVLRSLGMLRLMHGEQPSSRVRDVIEASLAITSIKLSDAETLTLLSPSIYSCLFRRLRRFSLNVDIDQIMLLEVLGHFEQMEELDLKRFMPSSPQPHLQLLKTLKKLLLDKTSSLWMEGCTFIKLRELGIGEIEQKIGGRSQCVQMVNCRFAALPQSISSESFQMPRLRALHLLSHAVVLRRLHYPNIQQFKLHSISLHFVDCEGLQATLAMQSELEALEIRGLPKSLDALMEPATMDSNGGLDKINHNEGSPMPESPLCPKLKILVLEMEQGLGPWNQEVARELERVRNMEKQTRKFLKWEQELVEELEKQVARTGKPGWLVSVKWWEQEQREMELMLVLRRRQELSRKLESARGRESKLQLMSTEGWKISAVRQCRALMKRRMEKGYPLQRCQLVLGSPRTQTEITIDSIGLSYLDMPDAEFISLGDIFAVWQLRDLLAHGYTATVALDPHKGTTILVVTG